MSGKPTSVKHLEVDPIPVVIIKSPEELTELAVEFGATSTWTAPLIGSADPIQILQRRPTRLKARIIIPAIAATVSGSQTAGGVATPAPAANTVLANSPVLQPGTYQVAWTVQLEGTLAAGTDNNNFQLRANSATFATSINPALANTYPQQQETIQVLTAGTIAIRNTLAGTAGSIYTAFLTVTQIATATTAVALAYRKDYLSNANNPQGLIIPASALPREINWETQQPCYAAGIGGPFTAIVLDQAQAATQSIAEESVEEIEEQYQTEGQGGRGYEYEPGPGYQREIND